MTKYWIGVASKKHVLLGVDGGFAMLNHGKRAPLAKMKANDYLIYYAAKIRIDDDKPLQKFVAVGRLKPGDPYQVEMSKDFKPYRKDVEYLRCEDAEIRPLIDDLEFIKNKKSWGYAFRYGHIEISKNDFEKIATAMKADI